MHTVHRTARPVKRAVKVPSYSAGHYLRGGHFISTYPTLDLLQSFLLQAKDLLTNYQTGVLENSPKMVLLFHLIEESVKLGDKILVFR